MHVFKTKGNFKTAFLVKRRRSQKTQGSFGRHTGLSCIQKNPKQANDSIFKENDTVFTDKKQVAESFNEHFAHIADCVGEITDDYYGEGFYDHPSIKVIEAKKTVSAFN